MSTPRTANGAKAPQIDDVSKAIIEQLQEDGRQSYATIAKRVGLSEAAVRQRVQRLLDQEVMQIVAVTDPLQVGFRRQAMIGIRVDGDLTPVGDALSAMDEVDYVVTTAGSAGSAAGPIWRRFPAACRSSWNMVPAGDIATAPTPRCGAVRR